MGQPDQARPPGSACVWVVAALLLLAVLAGGGCLVLYVALPLAEVPPWLPVAGLALVALPWAFWIATCAYRCCCSWPPSPPPGTGTPGNAVERQPSAARPAAVAPLPSSTNLKSALSAKHGRPPSPSSGARRVRFGGSTVLGEKEEKDAGEEEKDDDGGSSVNSHESEEPLAYPMHSS